MRHPSTESFDAVGKRQALTPTAADPERHVARQCPTQLPHRPLALPSRSASTRAYRHRARAGRPGGRNHLADGQVRAQVDRIHAELDGDRRAGEDAELVALPRKRGEENR
jgi:hypothetical protein